jgi:hypothetical protein
MPTYPLVTLCRVDNAPDWLAVPRKNTLIAVMYTKEMF